ncbi:Leucine-Rich Repeat-Containing Protein 56 [Manis pentadactyla]|nr:Leucine-Rich Repeat-Containing Protein 56 [Manis pentadactyla]
MPRIVEESIPPSSQDLAKSGDLGSGQESCSPLEGSAGPSHRPDQVLFAICWSYVSCLRERAYFCLAATRPPTLPLLRPPAAHPTADAAPPRGHPCRDAPYIMSSAGRGWGSGQAPALGSLTKSSFSAADDRLWEQQLELRKEVSPLS